MNALTDQQHSILDAIRQSMDSRGYPPTITELGAAVGLASRDRVVRQLRILQFKGWIQPVPGTSKVRILDPQETPHGAA
jgi:repressor LexA